MKLRTGIFALLLSLLSVNLYANWIIYSQEFTADPAPLVYNGRVYLFCSHDREDMRGWQMRDYICISSDDMVNWTDHGIVFDVRSTDWARTAWAPEITYKNGKFYLYYCNPDYSVFGEGTGTPGTGVAVSDSPTGPFVDMSEKPIRTGVDCAVLNDTDGQSYIYWPVEDGVIYKLTPDMLGIEGEPSHIGTNDSGEASYITHIGGKYQYSYMSFDKTRYWKQYTHKYMIADTPTGPFRDPEGTPESRIFMWPVPGGDNTQPGIFKMGENYYSVYHSKALAMQLDKNKGFQRNVGVDRLYINNDGTFKLQTLTEDGLRQLKYVDPYRRNEAESMAAQHGIKTEPCLDIDGGINICGANRNDVFNEDWTGVRGVDFGTGARSAELRLASPFAGSLMEIRLDSLKGRRIARIEVPKTGGWQQWETVRTAVENTEGIHDLYFVFINGGCNLNWWQFAGGRISGSVPPPVVKQIALKTHAGDAWLAVGKNGKIVPTTDASSQEIFNLIDNEDGTYSLQSRSTGNYMTFIENTLAVSGKNTGAESRFGLYCTSDKSYALRAINGKYVNLKGKSLDVSLNQAWDAPETSRFFIEYK